jgi:DNA-binding response OmpR family regulator
MTMVKRLLVVDDEPNLLRAVAVVLRGENFEVSTARNSREALVSVAQNLPDLIVSDANARHGRLCFGAKITRRAAFGDDSDCFFNRQR